MAVTQPITGAKVREPTSAVGTPSIANQRLGVFPKSVDYTGVVSRALQVRDTASFAKIHLDLTAPVVPGGNFDFGGGQVLLTHAYAPGSLFGDAAVTNSALTIAAAGWGCSAVSTPTVVDSVLYGSYRLELAEPLPGSNTNFVFGTTQALYPRAIGSEQRWGASELEQPLALRPVGFLSTDVRRFGGVLVLPITARATFNLNLLESVAGGYNFVFGTTQALYPRAIGSEQRWGVGAVSTAAKTIFASGIYSGAVGIPIVTNIGDGWIEFSFDQGYSHPHTANLGFYFAGGKQLDVAGWQSTKFGTPEVDFPAEKVRPDGWASEELGTPRIMFVVKPHSWDSAVFQNQTTVDNWFKYIRVYPFTGQPEAPPRPEVYNLLQFVTATGIAPPALSELTWVSNYYRSIYPHGADHGGVGTPKVAIGKQYIEHVYLPGTQSSFGTPFADWGVRHLHPLGTEFTEFGGHEVKETVQRCYPVGMASLAAFGVPEIKFNTQWCYPFSSDMSLYGFGTVYLYAKVISPASIVQWLSDSDRFGYYTEAYTRNKRITTNGYVDSRFSRAALVYNNARPVYVRGDSHARVGVTFVSHKVRSVYPEWYTQEVFGTPYAKTRKVISLDGWGWRSSKFGLPVRVWSNLQTIKPYSTYPHTEYGKTWVSEAARSLYPASMLTQPAGDPFVSYAVRYIEPASIDPGYMGLAQLETKQYVIRAWGYLDDAYGIPSIKNVTPTIWAYGAVCFIPGGKPRVELMKRYVHPVSGGDTLEVPKPFVSYRTRKIRAPSPDYLRWGNGKVMFDQSQMVPPVQNVFPPSVQAGAGVVPTWEWEDEYAPWSGEQLLIPDPVVKLHTIYAMSLGRVDRFGEPTLSSNVIFCDPGYADGAFGEPSMSGGTQWVRNPTSIPGVFIPDPHVVGAQIIRCGEKWDYQHSMWYPWDFHTYGDPEAPWYSSPAQTVGAVFGWKTDVSLQHRKVLVHSYIPPYGFAEYGDALITTRPQYIRPKGLLSYKRGIPEVLYVGDVPIYVYSFVDSVFGQPSLSVEDWGPKWVYPRGINEAGFGSTRVELFHREVHARGSSHFVSYLGAQYVGPYLRIYAKPGLDHSEFGTLYIDYRHRRIYPLDVVDDREPWSNSRAVKVKHAARGYFVEGTYFGVQFGMADVGGRVKQVMTDDWEEFSTGFSYVPDSYPGYSRVRSQSFIVHPYVDTWEFGNGTVTHG